MRNTFRRSVYWVDKTPPTAGPDGYTIVNASRRIRNLAIPKKPHPLYEPSKVYPFPIPKSALTAKPSKRIETISRPKALPEEYLESLTVDISRKTAVKAKVINSEDISKRNISQNARKEYESNRIDVNIKNNNANEKCCKPELNHKTTVKNKTQLQQESAGDIHFGKVYNERRLVELAKPKALHPEYQEDRDIMRSISQKTLRSIASERIQRLSQPNLRKAKDEDYDPYKIPVAALHFAGSSRLDELATPLANKVTNKYVFTKYRHSSSG